MHTQEQIASAVRESLPYSFGRAETVDRGLYMKKHDALVAHATAVSKAPLSSETLRYQSMLLYTTLVFVGVYLFKVKELKVADYAITVDRRMLLVYSVFMAAVTAVFLLKAYVDIQRNKFVLSKSPRAYSELQELIQVGILKRRVQEYFWFELFDVIGAAYKTYDDALSQVLNKQPTFEPLALNAINVDVAALKKVPALTSEIGALEAKFADLSANLREDERQFSEKAKEIVRRSQAWREDQDELRAFNPAYDELEAAYGQHLRGWFEARGELTSEHLGLAIKDIDNSPETLQLKAMLSVLKRAVRIRWLYAALEIVAPPAFAAGAIVTVWAGL